MSAEGQVIGSTAKSYDTAQRWLQEVRLDVIENLSDAKRRGVRVAANGISNTSSGGWAVTVGTLSKGNVALELWLDRYLDGRTPRLWAGILDYGEQGHVRRWLANGVDGAPPIDVSDYTASAVENTVGITWLKSASSRKLLDRIIFDSCEDLDRRRTLESAGMYFSIPTLGKAQERRRLSRRVIKLFLQLLDACAPGTTQRLKKSQPEDEPDAANREAARVLLYGRATSPAVRRAIERRAEDVACAELEAQGWAVKRVGTKCSYDLHCTRKGKVLRVEVKGTQGRPDSVILTGSEYEVFKLKPPAVMIVVHQIGIKGSRKNPVATGGIVREYNKSDILRGSTRTEVVRWYAHGASVPPRKPRLIT